MPTPDATAEITRLVTSFFMAVEANDWPTATTKLAGTVQIGHDNGWEQLTNEQLITSWEASHSRFATTEYRVETPRVEVDGDQAVVHLPATISLGRPSTQKPAVAMRGAYTIQVERNGDTWLIRALHHRAGAG